MQQEPHNPPSGVLDRASIASMLARTPPLVEGVLDPETQLQPNGIDLTLRTVAALDTPGQLGVATEDRVLSQTTELAYDAEGYVQLAPGCYLITLNEVVHLPKDMAALGWQRSSLLRSGVTITCSVWDAGYEGRSQCLLTVLNPKGFRLARNARVVQIVFFPLAQSVTQGYQGIFQRENL